MNKILLIITGSIAASRCKEIISLLNIKEVKISCILTKEAKKYVKISGINVGKIIKLDLDLDDYNAKIYIKLNNEIKIPDDPQARITSSSLLGGNFLDIIPGSSETYLKPDDIIYDTTDAVSFTDLLGKVVFSKE